MITCTPNNYSLVLQVWDLTDVMAEAPPTATPPPSLSPHVTLHVNNNCGRPLVWIKPGTLITIATGQANQFLPPLMPPVPPGQVHIMQPRHIPAPMFPGGFQATLPGSDMEVWEVAKYIDGTKKRPSQVSNDSCPAHLVDLIRNIHDLCYMKVRITYC